MEKKKFTVLLSLLHSVTQSHVAIQKSRDVSWGAMTSSGKVTEYYEVINAWAASFKIS